MRDGRSTLILSRLRKGLFLERPGNFSGPYFEINTCWIVGTVLNSQTGQFASLTASFNVPFSKLLEYKHDKHKTAFRAQNGMGTFRNGALNIRPVLLKRHFSH